MARRHYLSVSETLDKQYAAGYKAGEADMAAKVRALITTMRGVEIALRESGLCRSADAIAEALKAFAQTQDVVE